MATSNAPVLGEENRKNYFFSPIRRDDMVDDSSAFTLLDTLETYLDSHVDLFQRQLQRHSDRLRTKAEDILKMREFSSAGDNVVGNLERELRAFKLKVYSRTTKLASTWQSAKVIRTREKISFFFGVMSLLLSALLFGLAPQWVHISYTVQALYLLPLRVYLYKKRAWHYFCSISATTLASAVITWRNSLVFHDLDKVTSLFIHIYPPFCFTVIRHYYPNAEERFPALPEIQHLNPWRALLLSAGIYSIWQLLYWKFVFVDRREKIESGQRTSSVSWLLNSKSSLIGKALSKISPEGRIPSFMFGQLIYSIVTELPAVFILYDSPFWSGTFLIAIFSVSVWNGGGFYIEVFGRKFERELEALRKELAESAAQTSPPLNGTTTFTEGVLSSESLTSSDGESAKAKKEL
ncbi:hypothetical protein C8R42DRAFT_704080 [Lentinula raphanica]|nr:hypothetical protein C8R42DRAFT_704080 [Lentinula raphanica]